MRRLTVVFVVALVVCSRADVRAATIYRWQDRAGALHFSNRPEVVPEAATALDLPPVRFVPAPRVRASVATAPRLPERVRPNRCAPPDASGVIDAVAHRLARTGQLGGLTLLVAGDAIAADPDAVIARAVSADDDGAAAVAEQAALAYPAGAPCPRRPALARYPVASRRPAAVGRDVCEDYRRAFAEVGVAVSRDQGIARSFRAIAEDFTRIAMGGYVAAGTGGGIVEVRSGALAPAILTTAPGTTVALPPWVVEAHIAQTAALGAETAELVDELTVALEEIDRAARARRCW